jgi:hypothetical protein
MADLLRRTVAAPQLRQTLEKEVYEECAQWRAPSKADKGYLANCFEPIRVLSPTQVRMKNLDLMIGSAIGRFIRRT